MSSTYQLICMNHDPAILFLDAYDYQSGADGLARIEDAARTLRGDEHDACDVLIGRWSGALVEIGCPRGQGCMHRDVEWIRVEWLRLLTAARSAHRMGSLDDMVLSEVDRVNRCWSPVRLERLYELLKR